MNKIHIWESLITEDIYLNKNNVNFLGCPIEMVMNKKEWLRESFPNAVRCIHQNLSRWAWTWPTVSSAPRWRTTSTSWLGAWPSPRRGWAGSSSTRSKLAAETRGRGPSPRWWRRAATRRAGSTSWSGIARSHWQYQLSCDFLPVYLSAIHMLESSLGRVGIAVLHIGKSSGKEIKTVHGQVNGFHVTVNAKNLKHVILGDVAREMPNIELGRFRCWAPFAPPWRARGAWRGWRTSARCALHRTWRARHWFGHRSSGGPHARRRRFCRNWGFLGRLWGWWWLGRLDFRGRGWSFDLDFFGLLNDFFDFFSFFFLHIAFCLRCLTFLFLITYPGK